MSSRDKNPARAPLVEDSSSEDSRQVPRRLLADQDRISKPSELHAGRSREQRKRIHSANLAKTPVGGRGPKQSGSSSGRQGPHYTVSKDCSRPEDVNREFRLKWIIESLEDLSGPVSPSAGIRARGAAGPATNSLRKMAFHPGIPEIELLPKPEDESPSPEGEKLSPNSPLSELDSVEEADAQLVPTLIEWNHGGEIVYVTGTFTNWEKKYRLHQRLNAPGMFVRVNLPRGTHHLKFVVDGEMVTSQDLPSAPDINNVVVNYIDIEPEIHWDVGRDIHLGNIT